MSNKECTTHHHACACIEEQIGSKNEIIDLRKAYMQKLEMDLAQLEINTWAALLGSSDE